MTPCFYGDGVLSHAVTLVDVPRPFLDTISSTSQALSVFSLTMSRPARAETLVLLLDSSRRGVALLSDTSRHTDQGLGLTPGTKTVRFDFTTDGKWMVKPQSWSGLNPSLTPCNPA